VTFAPEPGFVGRTTPVRYQVVDVGGGTDQGTLRVTVRRGPVAQDDTARTPRGAATTADVVANDDPGLDADGSAARFDRGVVLLESSGLPPGARISPHLDQVSVPGQGHYTVQRVSGDILFVPDPGFTGVAAPVRFRVLAQVRTENGPVLDLYLDSSLRVTVDPATPTARADTATTAVGRPVVVPVLDNDAAGATPVPLVATSVELRLTDGLPIGSALSGDTRTLTVAGRGVFLVAGDGDVTFVPLGTRTGTALTVGYSVADTNGTRSRSTLTVTVR
jgi:CshA-type fibril repeat protein